LTISIPHLSILKIPWVFIISKTASITNVVENGKVVRFQDREAERRSYHWRLRAKKTVSILLRLEGYNIEHEPVLLSLGKLGK